MNKQLFKNNLRHYYSLATDEQISLGLNWYARAQRHAHVLAHRYDVEFDTTCRVVAVISPKLNWEINVIEAELIISAYKDGQNDLRCRALHANVEKAFRILNGDVNAIKGPKVEAFYHNIRHSDSQLVTIDKHAWRACIADPNEKYEGSVPKKYLPAAREAYTEVAQELGLRPCDFQAVVWLVIKSHRPVWKGG